MNTPLPAVLTFADELAAVEGHLQKKERQRKDANKQLIDWYKRSWWSLSRLAPAEEFL